VTQTLTRKKKLVYGVGDTGFSLTTTIIGVYFLIFLTDVVGIRPAIAAAAIFIGRSWDYVNDPLIGHISDRTRSRWGRRRPYLLFGALPFTLAFALMWWRPPIESVIGLAAYYAVAYVIFDAAATFVYMPYFALTPELTSDYDERTSLTTYRMLFSILGSLLAFPIPPLLVGAFSPENAGKVFTMGALFGVVSALPFFLVFFGTREREAYMHMEKPSLRQSLQAALKNRPFRIGMMIFLLTWVAIEIVQDTLIFFIKYVVQREAESSLILAVIFVTALFALPIWEWVSRRWSKRWAYIIGISFWAGVQMVIIALSPATALPLILGLCVLAGVGVAAAHVLPWAILPDAVEWGEWQTGERHEGAFYSLVTLSKKVATSIAIPLVGLILDFSGYVPNAVTQPPAVLAGIRIAIGPIPALMLCGGIAFALVYPITREQFANVVREIEARRRLGAEEHP
jgi:GPH family glycoside/pentoside/hexuronide:cation symporter